METASGLRERVQRVLSVGKISARKASKLAGLPSPAYVGMLARGNIVAPKAAVLASIASALHLPAAWLAFGHGAEPTDEELHRWVQTAKDERAASDEEEDDLESLDTPRPGDVPIVSDLAPAPRDSHPPRAA